MTYTRPLRRTILSSGLIFFTLARTFTIEFSPSVCGPHTYLNKCVAHCFNLIFAVSYPTLRQIVRCQFYLNAVSWHEANVVFPHPAGDMSYYWMAVFKFDSKLSARKGLNHCSGQLDDFF